MTATKKAVQAETIAAPARAPAPGVATRPAPFMPTAPASSAIQQTMREAVPKKFGHGRLQPIGQDYTEQAIKVPKDWDIEDILNPIAWVNNAERVSRNNQTGREDWLGSKIHAYAEDGAFLVNLLIRKVLYNEMKKACGLDLVIIGPQVDPETGAACAIDLNTGKPWQGRPKPEEKAV
jgi:hypothetical protein